MNPILKRLAIATAMLGCGAIGCTTQQWALESRLDTASGLTIATLAEPITLARSAPRFSHAARDYLYLGPVQINRMGAKEHYLWLGVASTVDRAPLGEQPPLPTNLVFIVDDLPMYLSLETWDPTLTGSSPYAAANAPYLSLGSRVTLEQLAILAAAKQVRVYLETADGPPARYQRWAGEFSDWAHSSGTVAANRR